MSKEECQAKIDALNNVCGGCGGELKLFENVDNSGNSTFWSSCLRCCVCTPGCKIETFEIAKTMVEKYSFNYYNIPNNTNLSDNIRKAAQIVTLVESIKRDRSKRQELITSKS